MKKVHSINREALRLLTTALLLFVVCVVANAYDFRVDGIYYKVLDATERTCEVTYLSTSNSNYSAYQGSVVIPSTVEYDNVTYAVRGISDSAFEGCSGLNSVAIPNSVTSIGFRAFLECSGLTGVTIGNSVETIDNYAFAYCRGLTEVTIPESVTSIGGSAFEFCSGLTGELIIPNSVTTIGSCAFYYCSGLTSVSIGESMTSIGEYAFYGCTGLEKINFNAIACTSAGSSYSCGVFYRCTNISKVIFGDNVTCIPAYLCYDCTGLTGELIIPNSVTTIGDYAFYNCHKLVGITSLNQEPPTCSSSGSGVFYNVNTRTCILYVPEGSLGAYANTSPWSSFYNIIEIEVDAIADITTNGNAEAVGYYTLDGKQVPTLQRGINIIRYSDGIARKVLVK